MGGEGHQPCQTKTRPRPGGDLRGGGGGEEGGVEDEGGEGRRVAESESPGSCHAPTCHAESLDVRFDVWHLNGQFHLRSDLVLGVCVLSICIGNCVCNRCGFCMRHLSFYKYLNGP